MFCVCGDKVKVHCSNNIHVCGLSLARLANVTNITTLIAHRFHRKLLVCVCVHDYVCVCPVVHTRIQRALCTVWACSEHLNTHNLCMSCISTY